MKHITIANVAQSMMVALLSAAISFTTVRAASSIDLITTINPLSDGDTGAGNLPNSGDVTSLGLINPGEIFYINLPRDGSSLSSETITDFRFGLWSVSLDTPATLSVNLYGGTNTTPGATMAGVTAGIITPTTVNSAGDVSTESLAATLQTTTLLVSGNPVLDSFLAPNSTFWIGVQNTSSTTVAVYVSSRLSPSANVPSYQTTGLIASSAAPDTVAGIAGTGLDSGSAPYFQLSVDTVPEPTIGGLLLSAVAMGVILPRFRRI